jgi:hypothetical protein
VAGGHGIQGRGCGGGGPQVCTCVLLLLCDLWLLVRGICSCFWSHSLRLSVGHQSDDPPFVVIPIQSTGYGGFNRLRLDKYSMSCSNWGNMKHSVFRNDRTGHKV